MNKMKIAILGSSGQSGKFLTEQALADGHHVVALVRNPEKMAINHDNLEVRKANIFSVDSLAEGFEGCDAVMSCLGAAPVLFGPVTLCQDSIKVIVPAVRKANIKRLIPMSSECVRASSDNPFLLERILKPLYLGKALKDLAAMEDYILENCQDLDYTVVKPPRLDNSPMSNEELITEEKDFSPLIRRTVPRQNVTRFMLECLTSQIWMKKLVTVGIKL